jgi:hypothetical protein
VVFVLEECKIVVPRLARFEALDQLLRVSMTVDADRQNLRLIVSLLLR